MSTNRAFNIYDLANKKKSNFQGAKKDKPDYSKFFCISEGILEDKKVISFTPYSVKIGIRLKEKLQEFCIEHQLICENISGLGVNERVFTKQTQIWAFRNEISPELLEELIADMQNLLDWYYDKFYS